MSAGFTPGPWEVRDRSVFSVWRCVARMDWEIRDTTDDANASLIAAAPALYGAGQSLLEAAERHIFGDECKAERDAFRTALKQARGEV